MNCPSDMPAKLRFYGSTVIVTVCFLAPAQLWFTAPEVAGLVLLFIPVLNAFGSVLFLTWINFYRKTNVGIALLWLVTGFSLFNSLDLLYEFSGLPRSGNGCLQLLLAAFVPLFSFVHVHKLKRAAAKGDG